MEVIICVCIIWIYTVLYTHHLYRARQRHFLHAKSLTHAEQQQLIWKERCWSPRPTVNGVSQQFHTLFKANLNKKSKYMIAVAHSISTLAWMKVTWVWVVLHFQQKNPTLFTNTFLSAVMQTGAATASEHPYFPQPCTCHLLSFSYWGQGTSNMPGALGSCQGLPSLRLYVVTIPLTGEAFQSLLGMWHIQNPTYRPAWHTEVNRHKTPHTDR